MIRDYRGLLKNRTPISITTIFATGGYAINKAGRIDLSLDTFIITKS